MNRSIKVLSIILTIISVAFLTFTVVQPVSFADSVTPSSIGTGTDVKTTEMQDLGKKVVGVVRAAGIIISVIMLMVIGIKYMLGSAEEKAEYKKSLMPYIIGAVLLLAASSLSGAIYEFVTK